MNTIRNKALVNISFMLDQKKKQVPCTTGDGQLCSQLQLGAQEGQGDGREQVEAHRDLEEVTQKLVMWIC